MLTEFLKHSTGAREVIVGEGLYSDNPDQAVYGSRFHFVRRRLHEPDFLGLENFLGHVLREALGNAKSVLGMESCSRRPCHRAAKHMDRFMDRRSQKSLELDIDRSQIELLRCFIDGSSFIRAWHPAIDPLERRIKCALDLNQAARCESNGWMSAILLEQVLLKWRRLDK